MRRLVFVLAIAVVLCAAQGAQVSGLQEITLTIPGVEQAQLKMALIPAGSFTMGSPTGEVNRDQDEGPQHNVTISKPFYMGIFEVTQAQWAAVMGTKPSLFGYSAENPVEQVSWNDCQMFISKLNSLGIGTFRLPTEAEWEYACRAGSTTRFYWGDDLDYRLIEQYAWCETNSGNKTHAVGQKKPNAWGLYDMCGNVYEWCSDWYSEYKSERQTDPKGPETGALITMRGGSFFDNPRLCRSANRNTGTPSGLFSILSVIGLRLVRTP